MNKSSILLLLGVCMIFSMILPEYSTFHVPKNWPSPVYKVTKQTLNPDLVAWGRVLFYDPILSRDSSTSCSSCHSVYHAFAHTDHAVSHGIEDRIGFRNAPALMNLAWQPIFMWDGAVHHLDALPLAPITNPTEMDENPEHILTKLNRDPKHRALFEKAFGHANIETHHYTKALSAFLITLISDQSKYDRVMRGEEQFTEQELRGYKLFQTNCASCHAEPLFTNFSFASNGLTATPDSGRSRITSLPSDRQLFKVPTLRNVEYSKPYMHDGRYKTLREVLHHYTSLNQFNPSVSNYAQTKGQAWNEEQQTELLAFLLTLSDSAFVYNSSFTYPFEILKNKP